MSHFMFPLVVSLFNAALSHGTSVVALLKNNVSRSLDLVIWCCKCTGNGPEMSSISCETYKNFCGCAAEKQYVSLDLVVW